VLRRLLSLAPCAPGVSEALTGNGQAECICGLIIDAEKRLELIELQKSPKTQN
jgi:hypothetical protein